MSSYEQEQLWIAAKGLAKDAAFKEVMRRLREIAKDDWANSAPEAEAKRMEAYYMVRSINALEAELTALAAEPDLARFNRRLRKA